MDQQGHSTKALNGSVSSGMWGTSCFTSLLLQGNFPALLFQQAAPMQQGLYTPIWAWGALSIPALALGRNLGQTWGCDPGSAQLSESFPQPSSCWAPAPSQESCKIWR